MDPRPSNSDYKEILKTILGVLLYSYYTTIAGWGVLLRDTSSRGDGCGGGETLRAKP